MSLTLPSTGEIILNVVGVPLLFAVVVTTPLFIAALIVHFWPQLFDRR